jgi:hypothetical protein
MMTSEQLSKRWFCPHCGTPARRFEPPRGRPYWTASCHHTIAVRAIGKRELEAIRKRYAQLRGKDPRRWIAACDGTQISES